MPFVFQIIIRFLFRKGTIGSEASDIDSNKKLTGNIAVVAIIGLSLGVAALLVVTSVMNGFERELKRALTGFHGHVLFFSKSDPIISSQKYEEQIKKLSDDVVSVEPYVFAEVMLNSENGAKGIVVEGLTPSSFDRVTEGGKKLVTGTYPARTSNKLEEILLGAEVARKLKVQKGDKVTLTIPFAIGEIQPILKELTVSGIIQLGMFEYDDKYALMDLAALQECLNISQKISGYKIITNNSDKSVILATKLNENYLYPMRARDWSSLNKNLFYAIRHQKAVIGIILIAIILVASFNIISTLMMLLHEKKSQISLLKALGWGSKEVFQVFLLVGLLLSVLGTLLGLVMARLLCGLIQWKSIIDLPADIYFFSRLPVEIRWTEWLGISLFSVLLAAVSTLIPSIQISRRSPVEGLRYE